MSTDIRYWVVSAIRTTGVDYCELDSQIAQDIQNEARERFVKGSPRVWWLSLKVKPQIWHSAEISFLQVVPPDETGCFFIPETEEAILPVFEISIKDVPKTIENSPFFEYYVLSKTFDWLLIESDHNEFILCQVNGNGEP